MTAFTSRDVTSSRDITSDDEGYELRCTGNTTLTLNLDSDAHFEIYDEFAIFNNNSTSINITLAAVSGVVLKAKAFNIPQYGHVIVEKVDTDEWEAFGDLI